MNGLGLIPLEVFIGFKEGQGLSELEASGEARFFLPVRAHCLVLKVFIKL